MKEDNYKDLKRKLRLKLLEMYHKAHAGHIGCSLSCIDLLIGSFILNKKEGEDLILSKGHAALALYVTLNHTGEISDEELSTFYQDGTNLPAHPVANYFKSIPFALGSLGHGLPIGTGIAKANKLIDKNLMTYVLMSDGETNEGTTWEATHFAVKHQLDNLLVMIDKNRLQGFGRTEDILGDTADGKKWAAIGFDVYEIDGHDIALIDKTIKEARNNKNGKPKVLIAATIKGKGVSYMENKMEWHYLPMNDEQLKMAMEEVNLMI
jgi:transketolase